MNIEIMRKHYERTPKKTLINVLVASREQVDKLQKRNKELKQEIERLYSIIKELRHYIKDTKQDGYKLVWIDKDNNYFESGIEEILDKEK